MRKIFINKVNPEEAQFAFSVLESDGKEFSACASQDVTNVAHCENGESDDGHIGDYRMESLACLDEMLYIGLVEDGFGIVGEFAG